MMSDPLNNNRYHSPVEQRVVYHNNGAHINASPVDTKAYMASLLTSLTNHVQALRSDAAPSGFAIHVVCHGAGVDLFGIVEADETLKNRFDHLHEQGVRFLVCANTLRARALEPKNLCRVAENDIVPSGVAELAWLQMQGFAYIHL